VKTYNCSSIEGTALSAFAHSLTGMFCGEMERAELLEFWATIFMLQTCCEGQHEQIGLGMNADPIWGRDFGRRLEVEPLTGHLCIAAMYYLFVKSVSLPGFNSKTSLKHVLRDYRLDTLHPRNRTFIHPASL
jgi:hypothetical protein